ncbi:hypothetical protein MOQ_003152 [Trypanosoma cruzi marinkellei]|uniref:Uncharacterized protein n=1 Tax=Trypanosoma cruzi marinkellei TaxID=85056 RepID=K2NDJ6_TRYCR|nr:hypothetical protein MOQ_003152 [Trypanosoma cruzi marinkellei]
MYHAGSASWNHLLPEPQSSTPAVCSAVKTTAPIPFHNRAREKEENNGELVAQIKANDWETEALRRYRRLKSSLTSISPQPEYLSSSASNGALLQLILRSKLLPITDWCECAQLMGSWFQGPRPLPLGLLSYVLTHLITTHKLTPYRAAKLILDLSKVLLAGDTDAGEPCGLVPTRSWEVATALERSVYILQSTEPSLFNIFSSVLLDLLLDEILPGGATPESWGLLPLCFLLKRNKVFMQSEWERDKNRHCARMKRACEPGCELPIHILAVLTAVV